VKVDGIDWNAGTGCQTVTATEDNADSQPSWTMEEVLRKENLQRALKRVRANKGAPGVDGMTVEQLPEHLEKHWPAIREQLLGGTYIPKPVRVVEIPKPGGGSRMLGIPTVLDRLIQQAVSQEIGRLFDPDFSDSSYGFRPGRSAHQAVNQARQYVAAGREWVVDIDLEKFFDQVNHDILMSRVARKVQDKRILKLVRRYLQAGLMQGGLVSQRAAGTPQGGPLSPLLSNVLLDDLDKELERRGHDFCRYADDCNVYVSSQKAAERVMASTTAFLERKLKLRVNREKSAVAHPWERKFLGYTVTEEPEPRLKVAPASVNRFKTRMREITRSGRGRNIQMVIKEIDDYLNGWFNYYRLNEVRGIFKALDGWIRRRLRKVLWQQWKTPRTRAKKLRHFGLTPGAARKGGCSRCGAWRSAASPPMQSAITNARLSEWGLISLLDLKWQLSRGL
jgi:group II intron reverse transcriptase/maturase